LGRGLQGPEGDPPQESLTEIPQSRQIQNSAKIRIKYRQRAFSQIFSVSIHFPLDFQAEIWYNRDVITDDDYLRDHPEVSQWLVTLVVLLRDSSRLPRG
jgi:hypothetical protein